ncbi:MAG: ComEC/Rec2 family competence protein, partial [Ktedonobacterales bacterium]
QRRLAGWMGWLPGGGAIAELLAVTIAAQVATLPVLALTFHEVSLVAPIANLLAVPLLAPLLVLGGLVALLGVFGGVAGLVALVVAWVVWPLLWFVDGVIAVCAVLPAAALVVPDLSPFVAWGYYAALAGAFWWAMRVARRGGGAAGTASGASGATVAPVAKAAHGTSGHVQLPRGVLVGVLVVALLGACGAAAPPLTDRMAHVDFMAVGPGGEATLVRLPSGVTVLIDGGPSGPALETQLSGKLPFWRRGLDLALLTDPRAGDANGVLDVGTHFTVAHATDAGMLHPSATYLAWHDAMRRAGAQQAQVREGDVIHLDAESAIRVLAPPRELYPADEGGTTASNDAIVRLELPGLRVLLLGAADDYALDALAYANEPLEADVVEVALPPDAPLPLEGPLGVVLAKAHPHLIVVASAPVSPDSTRARLAADANYEALDAETAGRFGALLYRTDVAGTVTLSGDASGWVVG